LSFARAPRLMASMPTAPPATSAAAVADNGIRAAWIDYVATVTGHRASMTATVK